MAAAPVPEPGHHRAHGVKQPGEIGVEHGLADICHMLPVYHKGFRPDKKVANAEALHARAYTLGRDIIFGRGQYAPATRSR